MAGARTSSSSAGPRAGAAAGARTDLDTRDRTALAARLHASTGDQAKTEAALRELGTSAAEAKRLAAQAAGTDQTAKPAIFAPAPTPATPPASPTTPKSSGGAGGVSLPTPSLRPPRRLSAADGGGFLLGLFLFALGQSYLRYGTVGVTSWFGAKFLNKPAASVVAAEGKRGITAKAHAPVSTPGAGAAAPTYKGTPFAGKAPSAVPPRFRLGGGS
jgi:hypothetical protein